MKDDAKAISLLKDAMVMLEEVQKARELPPYARVHMQYVALGREIKAFLKAEGAIQ